MKKEESILEVLDWGLIGYHDAHLRQKELVRDRQLDKVPDRLMVLEHFPVVTIGRVGSEMDLRIPEKFLKEKNIDLIKSDRGGKATYHGPGHLVAYPVIKLVKKDVHEYVQKMLSVICAVLSDYGLEPQLREGVPGVWVNDAKIASIGISVKKWVAFHGISINVSRDLSGFDCIVPCGNPDQKVTSMEKELDQKISVSLIKSSFIHHFKKVFGYTEKLEKRLPEWLRVRVHDADKIKDTEHFLKEMNLGTVCQSAHCPNICECFSKKAATFMILGTTCTRSCRFCAVEKGRPLPVDPGEPQRVAEAVKEMGLTYSVITSVTRDDLKDGGARHFYDTVHMVRELCPDTQIEILVPDFKGDQENLETVFQARPDMFNHNIETVPGLYPLVRPQATFERSLFVLRQAAEYGLPVKSGLMLGFGETVNEVQKTLKALKDAGCDYLTIGQYLAPSKNHIPVARYIKPFEFEEWVELAKSYGFLEVASGPLVRSSYRAEEFFARPSACISDVHI